MKKTAVLFMFAIGLLFLVKCSKPKTTPPGGATGVTVLPWEFDITIGNYRSHFKSSDKHSTQNMANYLFMSQGKVMLDIKGSSTIDPEFVAGDVLLGECGPFDEGLGIRKPVSKCCPVSFYLRNNDYVFFYDTAFEVVVKDLGKPYQLDMASGKLINGRPGLIEIPLQQRRCNIPGQNRIIDTVKTISGKIIFSSYKP